MHETATSSAPAMPLAISSICSGPKSIAVPIFREIDFQNER